jgi:molecular chaperone GrpE (heat shock protein)
VRNDLAESRKGLALRSVFDPTALALDQLEAIRRGFDPEKEQAIYGQVSAATSTLSNLLQSFGFTRFAPDLGAPFDPARMQCLGYAQGQPGVVLQVLRPGYLAGEMLVRPAGVLIADPERKADARTASKEGEEESCTK